MTDIVDDLKLVAAAPNMHGPLAGWCGRAAFEITTLRKELAEARAQNERLREGLRVLACTYFKDDQHQDYARHVLESPDLRPPSKAKGEKK